jgi:Domain of unknown function (DUF2017)
VTAIVTRSSGRYVLHLGKDERALLARLLGELRELVNDPVESSVVRRLFPAVYPDDAEREAEYQRLMREDLVSSRLAAVDVVESVLGGSGRRVTLDDAQMQAFVQSVNAVRLVLGTLLDVSEDEDESRPELVSSPEYQLYAYLSWLLDSAIHAMSRDL